MDNKEKECVYIYKSMKVDGLSSLHLLSSKLTAGWYGVFLFAKSFL